MPKETNFHRELRADMDQQGVLLTKVPDFPSSRVMREDKDGNKIEGFRFSPSRFVDLVGVGNEARADRADWGRPLIWEAKMVKSLKAWPFASLREEQLRLLLVYEARSAHARVLVNYRVGKYTDAQVKKYGLEYMVDHKRINALLCVKPSDILYAQERGQKSIPVKDAADYLINRPWGGEWRYKQIVEKTWTPPWRR